jgi:hypothetical protein
MARIHRENTAAGMRIVVEVTDAEATAWPAWQKKRFEALGSELEDVVHGRWQARPVSGPSKAELIAGFVLGVIAVLMLKVLVGA